MNLQAFVVPDRRRSPLVAQQRTQEASTKSRPGLLKAKRWTNDGRSINAAFPPPGHHVPIALTRRPPTAARSTTVVRREPSVGATKAQDHKKCVIAGTFTRETILV